VLPYPQAGSVIADPSAIPPRSGTIPSLPPAAGGDLSTGSSSSGSPRLQAQARLVGHRRGLGSAGVKTDFRGAPRPQGRPGTSRGRVRRFPAAEERKTPRPTRGNSCQRSAVAQPFLPKFLRGSAPAGAQSALGRVDRRHQPSASQAGRRRFQIRPAPVYSLCGCGRGAHMNEALKRNQMLTRTCLWLSSV